MLMNTDMFDYVSRDLNTTRPLGTGQRTFSSAGFARRAWVGGLAVIGSMFMSAGSLSAWTVAERAEGGEGLPGSLVEVSHDGRPVAEFVYGEGQLKPYLAIYDEGANRLTNPGIDETGETRGRFPHHRGIFIGWNQIRSDLGVDDLWHLRHGESMSLASIETAEANCDGALLVLNIDWRSQDRDNAAEGLLLSERRTIRIYGEEGRIRVDHHSELTAARDVELDGDLQHAGLHFRADADVDEVRSETHYLWEPSELSPGSGRIISDDLEWVNFRFPLHDNWYSVTQLNRPENGATELSWRDYGRFGFFRKATVKEGETFEFSGHFLIERIAEGSGDESAIRKQADDEYRKWTRSPLELSL